MTIDVIIRNYNNIDNILVIFPLFVISYDF